MEGGVIKAISRSSVHKICSGQVVLTLATAVKELVENSIDAGATIIEVKLKEHGSDLIEVIDNGKGIKPCDFQSLTLKHHTSKINDFSDVPFVSTFGFRGEALSSLCALSDLEVLTSHVLSPVGTLLTFDHDGTLTKKTPTPRQVGTTVMLRSLFHTLPVRRKEFLKNVRREFGKMVHLLTAYCLISLNKRITCTHIADKGRKSVILSTNSSENLRNNMLCVFGSKQVNQLTELTQLEPSAMVLEEYFLPESAVEKSKMFRLEGFLSNCIHGEGRSTADRQFFFINGRPCDLPKVSKLINEIYHTFNKNQYPFVLLNVVLTEGSADVNVTPDKRQVFIPEEKLLLAVIKTSLLGMYDSQPSLMKSCSSNTVFENQKLSFISSSSPCQNVESHVEVTSKRSSEDDDCQLSPPTKNQRIDNEGETCDDFKAAASFKTMINNHLDCPAISPETSSAEMSNSQEQRSQQKVTKNIGFTLTLPFREEKLSPKRGSGSIRGLSRFIHRRSPLQPNNKLGLTRFVSEKVSPVAHGTGLPDKTSSLFSKFALNGRKFVPNHDLNQSLKRSIDGSTNIEASNHLSMAMSSQIMDEKDDFVCDESYHDIGDNQMELSEMNEVKEEVSSSVKIKETECCVDCPMSRKKTYKLIEFDLILLKKELQNIDKQQAESKEDSFRKFRSKISPTENVVAEEELRKEISKEDFSQMDIIGQFNLGFIITRLNDDLFIIDQHATDEKYNYETLQKETVLETQKLLNPQDLSLTAVSEAVLSEHLHIFEKNGFRFHMNEDSPAGSRVQLLSVPVSHNWTFGKDDVDELIFMLTDNPAKMVRPSRVSQMFASRACRKSVMIGTALTHPLMKKLVLHMGQIEQPWNCPHGRPTMRHLFNLNFVR